MNKFPELESHYKVSKNQDSFSNSLCIQRSKRAQKFYNKDYTVNFSRIRVEKTDRLTRSKTRLDADFLRNKKLSKPLSQAICTIKSTNQEVMDESSEHNAKNVDNIVIITVTSDLKLTNDKNSNENRADNLSGKRDILLTSIMNDLQIPKNNSHTELIAFENEVIEFNPATDLDQMLKNSIDPDEYLSSLSHEEIELPLEISIVQGNTTTSNEHLSIGEFQHQDQKVELLSMNQSEMVKNENKFEEVLNNGKQLSAKSLQLFEKTIISQVPEIILKSEEETTLERINHIPSQSLQASPLRTNSTHLNATKEIKLQNAVLKHKNDENVLQNQIKHDDILSQKNMKYNGQTSKIMLQSSMNLKDQCEQYSSIWDERMLKFHVSRNETDTEKIIKTVDSFGTKNMSYSWDQKNFVSFARNEQQNLSENIKALEISPKHYKNSHENYHWNSTDKCYNNPENCESSTIKNQTHQYPSIKTSSTISQEIKSTIKSRPLKASPILNNKNQFELLNNSLTESHSVEKHTHEFVCAAQLSSSNTHQFDICTEVHQEHQNMPNAQSLWDTPAEVFLKTDQSVSKQFAISGGSIERVFSPNLKNIQKSSKYPGITIPTSARDIFLPNPSQQPMELENFEDEPKYQIELVDTPPPLVGNYKPSRSTPQIISNELRPPPPPPVESGKQRTMFKPKRGRRTRAEMELYREEMARRKQNKKKTDMERYIPNYFNQFNYGRTQMTAETPFTSEVRSAQLDFENWNQVSSDPFLLAHQTPPIRPSCSKLGYQVSKSAAIVHNGPSKYCHKRIEVNEQNPYDIVHQLYQSAHQVGSPHTSQTHHSAYKYHTQQTSKASADEQLHPMFQQEASFCQKLQPDHLHKHRLPFHTPQISQGFENSRSYFP